MKRLVLIGVTSVFLIGCSGTDADVSETATAERPVETDDTVETPVKKVDWRTQFSTDVPYYNKSQGTVQAYAAGSEDTKVVGQIAVGEGGFIQTCNDTATWCEITYGGSGAKGWVEMGPFLGVAN